MDESGAAPSPQRRIRPRWLALACGLILGIIFSVLLGFALVVHAGLWAPIAALAKGRTTSFNVSSPAVVDKIRQLNRLESVDYNIDKIVEGNEQAPRIPSFLVGDRLLLIAHGEVIAGVDLSRLDGNAVQVNGDTVHVRLPPPQILVSRVDNTSTRVYERSTGILVAPDPNLESAVRKTAEQEIVQAALADGILDKARQNAQVSVSALLYALGFRSVSVE